MMESGLWKDTQYSACVFAGARSKLQCLRHGDRGVAAFDVPPYSPPPRVGTTGEFRWQVVPV